LGEKFISIRIIKEKLEKLNRISVIEEGTDYIKVKVFRIGRIFGGPWLGPYPTVSFKISRNENGTNLNYEYFWPEYYATSIGSVVLGIVASTTMRNSESFGLSEFKLLLMLAIGAGLLTTVFMYIDISYYKSQLVKELKK